ncbi:DoxX family protein [Actinopolymorpha sp. B11F2]|uniref:DoxX family protein n=1 Tax=Actinopolymorpha sp. B11F2 TaxID=3160862 RepID=UPI0032E3E555
MNNLYLGITLLAIGANGFSGIAALLHFKPIVPGMVKAGVPQSWLTFPIGTLKTAGALGLLIGLIGVPMVGSAAAVGLILFFVCAVYTHLLANDYSPQFGLAIGFLLVAIAALLVDLPV